MRILVVLIKFLLILDHKSDPCPTTLPRIASETNTLIKRWWPASSALVDGVPGERLPPDGRNNYWAGLQNREAGFVTDLGCVKTITKIELRNTNYYNGLKGQVLNILPFSNQQEGKFS